VLGDVMGKGMLVDKARLRKLWSRLQLHL
jgi:hypothetical protein